MLPRNVRASAISAVLPPGSLSGAKKIDLYRPCSVGLPVSLPELKGRHGVNSRGIFTRVNLSKVVT